ncbi:acyl-CoA dehydrogenase [Achromobacter seleniivolatilans]|uniref:Acyl-CoA dehydrogenase n=1 Tax=Achromobacter seleniivolatilans TaxID=3047478 RepID=A0ABY9M593_9BURK|nr:acyl-CoA dehydrogenase [Achromobacter sp. R39]WMD22166.1 acyl-CoA dehydrogenase [Achromobacter sp. R39]
MFRTINRATRAAADLLDEQLADMVWPVVPGQSLRALVDAGCDALPMPGSGDTLSRWKTLAKVGAADLGLAKLFEGHTDALAILAELHGAAGPLAGSRWGVWCAEPPQYRVGITCLTDGRVELNGIKAWCSGALDLTHALVSGWDRAGRPCLAALHLDQAGVTMIDPGWHAVGMRTSATVNVRFDRVFGTLVGAPGAYVDRPGFLHGGAGVAACWYGGVTRVAQRLRLAASAPSGLEHVDPFRLAHLGAADTALAQARAVLREAASAIDAAPDDGCALVTARARLAVEAAAEEVLLRAARALGAGPMCQDAAFAQAMADLPVFIRQSHAERDQAAHGALVAALTEPPWIL